MDADITLILVLSFVVLFVICCGHHARLPRINRVDVRRRFINGYYINSRASIRRVNPVSSKPDIIIEYA